MSVFLTEIKRSLRNSGTKSKTKACHEIPFILFVHWTLRTTKVFSWTNLSNPSKLFQMANWIQQYV